MEPNESFLNICGGQNDQIRMVVEWFLVELLISLLDPI